MSRTIKVEIAATQETARHIYGETKHTWEHNVSVLDLPRAEREWVFDSVTHYVEGTPRSAEPESEEAWTAVAVAAIQDEQERQRRKIEESIAMLLESGPEKLLTMCGPQLYNVSVYPNKSEVISDPRIVELISQAQTIADRRNAEEAQRTEERKKHTALEEEGRRTKMSTRQAFVRSLMTGVDLERYDCGLMSEDEQRARARDDLLLSFRHCARYERLTNADVKHDDDCCAPSADFDVETAESLTAEEYASLREFELIAEKLPGTVLVAREHTGNCTVCDARVRRLSVLVTRTIGDWSVSREFALPQ